MKEIIKEILNFKIINLELYTLTVSKLLIVLLIIILTKIFLIVVKKALERANEIRQLQRDNIHALVQIIKYIVWIISSIIILDMMGVKITVLITGSAALLVGVGLGLQQTFNDFISGIILLFEGKTKIGDILEVDNDIIKLRDIGLRTTEGVDRKGVSIIIPNSKITTDKVINWTHQNKQIRFEINVGVAYGSDVDLVMKILKESASECLDISKTKDVEARFVDFADSSLNFKLLFFSKNIFRIERIKSDIRVKINKKFIENNINIPFPQMDVYMR